MGYLIDMIIGAASRIVAGELSAHVEPLARWIIGKSVKRLPAHERDRFYEEWLAHLHETPGALRKLWHAVGCQIASAKLEHPLRSQIPAEVERTITALSSLPLKLSKLLDDHEADLEAYDTEIDYIKSG